MRPPGEGATPPFNYTNSEGNAEIAKAILLEAVSAAAAAAAAAVTAAATAAPAAPVPAAAPLPALLAAPGASSDTNITATGGEGETGQKRSLPPSSADEEEEEERGREHTRPLILEGAKETSGAAAAPSAVTLEALKALLARVHSGQAAAMPDAAASASAAAFAPFAPPPQPLQAAASLAPAAAAAAPEEGSPAPVNSPPPPPQGGAAAEAAEQGLLSSKPEEEAKAAAPPAAAVLPAVAPALAAVAFAKKKPETLSKKRVSAFAANAAASDDEDFDNDSDDGDGDGEIAAPPLELSKKLDSKSCDHILCLTKDMAKSLLPPPPPVPLQWGFPGGGGAGATTAGALEGGGGGVHNSSSSALGPSQVVVEVVDELGRVWPMTYRCVPSRYSYVHFFLLFFLSFLSVPLLRSEGNRVEEGERSRKSPGLSVLAPKRDFQKGNEKLTGKKRKLQKNVKMETGMSSERDGSSSRRSGAWASATSSFFRKYQAITITAATARRRRGSGSGSRGRRRTWPVRGPLRRRRKEERMEGRRRSGAAAARRGPRPLQPLLRPPLPLPCSSVAALPLLLSRSFLLKPTVQAPPRAPASAARRCWPPWPARRSRRSSREERLEFLFSSFFLREGKKEKQTFDLYHQN